MPGPVPLVVIATIEGQHKQPDAAQVDQKSPPGKDGILVVAGSSLFAANSYFSQYANGDLFLNSINFLADEANLITFDRPNENKPLLLTRAQATAISWIVLVIVPLLVLISGIAVYRVRRSQR